MTRDYEVEDLQEYARFLRGKIYTLEDNIEAILDYLVNSHITVEEMEKVQEILEKKENNNE